jgi:hypothetical protein
VGGVAGCDAVWRGQASADHGMKIAVFGLGMSASPTPFF